MAQKESNSKLLLILALTGLLVAVLSVLETRVEWIASFCGFLGDGCRETESFTLLRIPVAFWGVGYYILLVLAFFFAGSFLFPLVMVGVGAEITFMWILFSMNWICVFCLLNLAVVILLFIFSFDPRRSWESLALILLFFVSSHFLLSQENRLSGPETAGKQDSTIVAKIGEEVITLEDLESPIANRLYELQTQMYQVKKDRLDEMIDKVLLQKEADRHHLPLQEFISNTILSDNITATDEEIERYYQQNQRRWANWQGSQEELRGQIRAYIEGQKAYHHIVEHARSLREEYGVTVLLREPPLPFTKVSIENSPVSGPADAPVTVVEFSDYLCPACRASHPVANRIKEAYKDQIRWVFKDFPLDRHKGAKKLAEAAQCAGEQGKFWEYQDLLFASSKEPVPDQLKQYAEQLNLDVSRFSRCFDSGKYASKVEKDIEDARQAGVGATPTFIINGRLRPGAPSFEKFKEMIDEELALREPSKRSAH